MNNIYELAKGLCDLVERSRRDINVDDVMIECVMQKIKDRHDQGIDCDMFLDETPKRRRKSLYAAAVREIKKYCKQAIEDNKEVRRKIAEYSFLFKNINNLNIYGTEILLR